MDKIEADYPDKDGDGKNTKVLGGFKTLGHWDKPENKPEPINKEEPEGSSQGIHTYKKGGNGLPHLLFQHA
jgi:hypothetical protein